MSRPVRRIGYVSAIKRTIETPVKISREARLRLGRLLQPKPLPVEAWSEIEKVTTMCSVLFDMNNSAIPAKPVEKKLRILASAATSLRIEITGKPVAPDEAPGTLTSIYTKYFQVRNINELHIDNLWVAFLCWLDGIIAICGYIDKGLKSPNGIALSFDKNNFWSMLLCGIITIMDDNKLRHGASKGKLGSNPFICLAATAVSSEGLPKEIKKCAV
jgi:hypothetical protein